MVVSASHDGTARIWDAWTGDCVAVLSGHTGRLNAVVASKDGSTIVTCSDDNSACVWDGNNYTMIRCAVVLGTHAHRAAAPAHHALLLVCLLGYTMLLMS